MADDRVPLTVGLRLVVGRDRERFALLAESTSGHVVGAEDCVACNNKMASPGATNQPDGQITSDYQK